MKTSAVDSALGPRRLRVAVLNRVFAATGGGAERYSIAVVEQLAARHDVHVFAQETSHEWPGVTYHHVSCFSKKPRWLNQLWYAYATWRATRQGFDIVHSHENTWHGHVQTIHVKTVKRSLFDGRTGAQRVLRWLKVALSPRLLSYVSLERVRMAPHPGKAIVAVSQALREELVAQYPQAAPCTSVITPGVNMPTNVMEQAQARRALDVPPEGQYVLFVANDYLRKGLPTLLKAMQSIDHMQLLVVGNPVQIDRFKAMATALGIRGRVHFLGTLQDMGLAYVAADVLAHPTLEDSFAMVVLEAMAHGLPVVVSGPAHCGISAQLTDGVNALLLANPQDADALRQALHDVLYEAATEAALSQAGKAFAQQHSWEHTAQTYDALYQQLTQGKAS
jgi:glycosyltransferase involved in cell wall biosynthesis